MSDPDHVTLKLAHPLSAEQAAMVGADPKQYRAGEEVVVPAGTAMTVINAGYAQVDPADQAAVRAALGGHVPGPGESTPAGGASMNPGASTPPAIARPVTAPNLT